MWEAASSGASYHCTPTPWVDENTFAEPRRANIHLIHTNMHPSGLILIIKSEAARCATDCSAGDSAAPKTRL